VRYGVDLAAAARTQDTDIAAHSGRDLILTPDLLLWTSRPPPEDRGAEVRFDLPPGVRAAVPWIPLPDGAYRVPASAWAWQGAMALGALDVEEVPVKGGIVQLVRLDGETRATPGGIRRWFVDAAEALATLHGRLPAPRILALVHPVPGRGGDAVPFAAALRGGGAIVHALLSAEATDQQLRGEWVAVHELAHHAMPFVRREDAWLSEGVATYYQNVLRARRGMISAAEAWSELDDGFRRGRSQIEADGDDLAAASASMHRTHRYWRVYWSGTAIALLIDLELRRRTRHDLDGAIAAVRGGFEGRVVRPSAQDVLQAIDRHTGTAIATEIAGQWLGSTAFPDLGRAYRELGLVAGARGALELDPKAPAAKIARAIMAGR
jgi:hypothetical protein